MKKYIIEPSNKTLREILDNITDDYIHIVFKEGFYITGCSDIDTLHIKAKNIILEGEGNVVVYDNKGHMINSHPYPGQPSSNAHTILVEADKVLVNNITFVNGCNIDFEYKGKLYKKVSECITQAYTFGAWNTNYLEINDCKFYSILDTFTMKNVDVSILNNCYVQGNNDFLPHSNKSYMKNCIVRNMGPYPVWSTGELAVYDQVIFNIDDNVNEFSFTKRGGNICFISCKFNTHLDNISFEIEPRRESRYYLYETYINNNQLNPIGYKESFVNISSADCEKIRRNEISVLSLGINGDRILNEELVLSFNLLPDFIRVSNGLHYKIINDNIIINSDIIGNNAECYIEAQRDFIVDKYYFTVIGKKLHYPKVIDDLTYRIDNSKLYIDYNIYEYDEIKDISYVLVYQEDTLLYKLNKGQYINILKTDINKSFKLKPIYQTTESKELIGEAVNTRLINASDVKTDINIDGFEGYELTSSNHFYMKHIEALYLGDECPNFVTFNINKDELPFRYSAGTDNAKGIKGLLYSSRGAALIYPIDEKAYELKLDIFLGVEKASGEGFGSANGQYLELFMNYDENTFSGIALRLEREATTDKGVFMSIRRYINSENHIVGKKIFTKNYLTNCHLVAEYVNKRLVFKLILDDKADILSVDVDDFSSAFMLRGTGTIGIGNRFLVRGLKLKC